MTRVVFKYELLSRGSNVVEMPGGSRVVSAGSQNDTVVVWAVCDPDAPPVDHLVLAVWTGEPFDLDVGITPRFVATIDAHRGLVYHVFDCGERTPAWST